MYDKNTRAGQRLCRRSAPGRSTTVKAAKRLPWYPILSGLCLLGAGLLWVFGRGGAVPAEGARVFYPGVMFYNYAAAPLVILIVLLAVGLLVLWLPQALSRQPGYRANGLAAGVALAAGLLACGSSLPRLLQVVNYLHVDRAALSGQVYQLGVRIAFDGGNYYVLCACDRLGLVCTCQHLPEAGPPSQTQRPELAADAAAGRLSIREGQATVYELRP